MRAAQINQFGEPSVIQINEVDKPIVGENQVLVEVHAASLNPFDTMVRTGYIEGLTLPITLGGDIAGIVKESSTGAIDFTVGDKVYGQAAAVAGNSGAFADFAVTKADQLAKAPENLDFEQAASLPLVGVSALQALTEHINLQSGQKIFIHGGGGGIGRIAIQLAKSLGAYVATTATGDDLNTVKNIGADQTIDYKSQDFTEVLSGYDAVFDTVGGDDFNKSLIVLKQGGIAVSMIAQADETKASELKVTALTQMTIVNTEKLNKLSKLVESGAVVPNVGQIFPLEQVQQAFETRESGAKGKVVLRIHE